MSTTADTAVAPAAATSAAPASAAATAASALTWFEIPVTDLERATRFYSAVVGAPLRRETFAGVDMAILPYLPPGGVGGALVAGPRFTPSRHGCLIYLPATGDDLDGALARVQAAGGEVVGSKIRISDQIGTVAYFDDSEGNRVALHARR